MIVYDVATKVLDKEMISSGQHHWPDLWHYFYCIVQSGEAFTVKWNKHIHTCTHARTHTHTHTHTHDFYLLNVGMSGFIFLNLGSLAAWNELLNNIRKKSICIWASISSCCIFKTYVASLFSFWKSPRFMNLGFNI